MSSAEPTPRKPGAITIPATSPARYLGGMAALNLPSGEGTGDWHTLATFFTPRAARSRSFISGDGCETNTNPLLGKAGIYDCSAGLAATGVPFEGEHAYAADHYRATADLVLDAVLEGRSPHFVDLDAWFHTDVQKQEVFDLLAVATKKLSPSAIGSIARWQRAQ